MFLRLTDLIGREKKISRNKNRSTERSISFVFQSYKGIEDPFSIINSIVILDSKSSYSGKISPLCEWRNNFAIIEISNDSRNRIGKLKNLEGHRKTIRVY